jgi:hypothetical protein
VSSDKDVSYKVLEAVREEKVKRTIYDSLVIDERVAQAQPVAPAPQKQQPSQQPSVQIDPNALKTKLARLFWTLDYMPKDTYNAFLKSLSDSGIDLNVVSEFLRNPDSVVGDPSKLSQIQRLEALLSELEQKGFYKKTPDEEPMYNAADWLAMIGQNWMLQAKNRWEEILNELNQGRIPQHRGTGSDALLNFLGKIDVLSNIVRGVEGTVGRGISDLAKRLGASDSLASEIGHDASMVISGALLSFLPPGVNIALIAGSIVDGLAQMASMLDTPAEKQQLLEMLRSKEFWANMAKDAALMAGGGMVGSAVAEQVTNALVKRIYQINPGLGAKLMSKMKMVEGTPIYTEEKLSYWIDPEKGVVYFRGQSTGQLISINTKDIGRAVALLEDPEAGAKIASIIGSMGDSKAASSFFKALDDLASWLGEDKAKALVDALSKSELKGITNIGVYRPSTNVGVVDLGGKLIILSKDKPTATLLDVKGIPKTEYSLYSLADETGLGAKLMDDVLKKALVDKQRGILYWKETSAGNLVITSDGKSLRIALGAKVIDIPLEGISYENWQRTLGAMQGLEKTLDPSTMRSVKELLRTQYGLTTPSAPPAYTVQGGAGEFKVQSILDLMRERFGFKTPSNLQESESASITATIDGKPFQIVLNKQVLGDDKASVLINELMVRRFDKSVFGKIGFSEDRVGVITLKRGARYLEGGELSSSSIDKAIGTAVASGDAVAVQELVLLKQALKQLESGSVKPVLIGSSSDEALIVVAGAGAQAINTMQQQLQRAVEQGDAQAIEQTLREVGLSEQEISKSITKVPEVTEATETMDKVVPGTGHEATESSSKETVTDTVVRIPQLVEATVTMDKVIPKLEYEVVENYSKETLRDTVVKIPQIVEVPIEREVVIPITEYETATVFSKETVQDTVVKIPQIIVLDKEVEVPVQAIETEAVEQYIVETVPGTVVTIPVMVEMPLYIFEVVDVIESEESLPPEETKPIVKSSLPPPPPLKPVREEAPRASLPGAPPPKGKGEREKLVI